MRRPPLIATLLLDWLAPGREALRGDLDEEFAAGRSRAWYWRQAASTIAAEGTLTVRRRAIQTLENWVTGVITLTLVGFYAVFVVNVTDWLLRFEGLQVIRQLPDAFGAVSGLAPALALVIGVLAGHLISAGHLRHRVMAVFAFGSTTMWCAATALRAASVTHESVVFLPAVMPQVATTAMFVLGLVGSIAAMGLRRPIVLLDSGGTRP